MSVFIPLFDWDAAERVARYTGFDPEKSELASTLLGEHKCNMDFGSGIPDELCEKGFRFATLIAWVDIVYNERGIPMPNWIDDWFQHVLPILFTAKYFFDLDPPPPQPCKYCLPTDWPPLNSHPPAKHGGAGQ